MGAMRTGVFYGVELAGGLHLREDDDPDKGVGLLDKWEALPAKRRGKISIEEASYGDKCLLGSWIAVPGGNRERRGTADISDMTITTTDLLALPQAVKAHASWEMFTKWAIEHGGDFVEPTMWLAPVEIG